MGFRITEYALRLAFEIVESAANTLTVVAIDTPVGQITSGGKVQAMECMKVVYDLQSPSQEDDMGNFSQAGLLRSSVVATPDINDPNVFWAQNKEKAIAAGAESINVNKSFLTDILDDGNGVGQLFYGGTIFGFIIGAGNATARFCDGYILYHLVELSAIDVVMALLTA